MKRVFPLLALLLFLGGSTGCRMCGSCDHLVPAFVNRPNDYRGADPLYRAGSIFGTDQYGSIVHCDNAANVSYPTYSQQNVQTFSDNAGQYGQTTLIDKKTPTIRTSKTYEPDTGIESIPTWEEIIKKGRNPQQELTPDTAPEPTPIQIPIETLPPPSDAFPPTNLPLPRESELPREPFPFSGKGPAIRQRSVPSSPNPVVGEPVITLESLRQLDMDPAVTEIKILNIEDSVR